jgi:hypothetical protein
MPTTVDWEATLREWAKPVDEQQEDRAKRTAEEIRKALSIYEFVPNSMMKVTAQGSKLNNTDTSDESDVDIRVEFHPKATEPDEIPPVFLSRRTALAKGLVVEDAGLTTYTMPLNQATFKDHVTQALEDQFGSTNVDRHDKCIKVSESRLLFPADIVPCFPVRTYSEFGKFEPGVSIRTDAGEEILNYPVQHYDNGVTKNVATLKRFKRMVRCLKRMENWKLADGRISKALPSFFMECLIYNCPKHLFDSESYKTTFLHLTLYLYGALGEQSTCDRMVEVNGVKSLFNDGQTWTAEEARDFVLAAWHEVYK